jgi:hypothetical protein
MAARVHRPFTVISFKANGIWRWCYELSTQLHDLHIYVALVSERHLKRYERFFIPNYQLYLTECFPGRKGRTAVAVRKCILHNHVHLPALVSTEATGVCIPIGNSEVLLAAVYNSPGHSWNGADIIEFLSFKHELLLADLNA